MENLLPTLDLLQTLFSSCVLHCLQDTCFAALIILLFAAKNLTKNSIGGSLRMTERAFVREDDNDTVIHRQTARKRKKTNIVLFALVVFCVNIYRFIDFYMLLMQGKEILIHSSYIQNITLSILKFKLTLYHLTFNLALFS